MVLEVSEAMSEAGGDISAVFYNAPPVFTETAVLGGLKQTMEVSKMSRLYWTPGDSVLAVWKIQDRGVDTMDGSLLTNNNGKTRTTVLRKCAQRRRAYKEAQARN